MKKLNLAINMHQMFHLPLLYNKIIILAHTDALSGMG